MPETSIRYYSYVMKPGSFYRSPIPLYFCSKPDIGGKRINFGPIAAGQLFFFVKEHETQSHCIVIYQDLVGAIFPHLGSELFLVEED